MICGLLGLDFLYDHSSAQLNIMKSDEGWTHFSVSLVHVLSDLKIIFLGKLSIYQVAKAVTMYQGASVCTMVKIQR